MEFCSHRTDRSGQFSKGPDLDSQYRLTTVRTVSDEPLWSWRNIVSWYCHIGSNCCRTPAIQNPPETRLWRAWTGNSPGHDNQPSRSICYICRYRLLAIRISWVASICRSCLRYTSVSLLQGYDTLSMNVSVSWLRQIRSWKGKTVRIGFVSKTILTWEGCSPRFQPGWEVPEPPSRALSLTNTRVGGWDWVGC